MLLGLGGRRRVQKINSENLDEVALAKWLFYPQSVLCCAAPSPENPLAEPSLKRAVMASVVDHVQSSSPFGIDVATSISIVC